MWPDEQKLIVSWSSNGNKATHDGRTPLPIDLLTGKKGCTFKKLDSIYTTHGILMFLGWGALLPIGVIFARHKPNLAPKPGEAGPGKTGLTFPHGAEVLWLAAHMFLQCTGVILMTAGFIYAHAKFPEGSWKEAKAHALMGNLVFAFGIIWPIGGFLRPDNPPAGTPKSKHRIAWEMVHKNLGRLITLTAMITIFLGLDRAGTIEKLNLETNPLCEQKGAQIGLMGDPKGWLIAYDIWFIVILLAFIVLEIKAFMGKTGPWKVADAKPVDQQMSGMESGQPGPKADTAPPAYTH